MIAKNFGNRNQKLQSTNCNLSLLLSFFLSVRDFICVWVCVGVCALAALFPKVYFLDIPFKLYLLLTLL